MENTKNIDKFFEPESIAVVGASTNPIKLGSQIFNNIIESGFKKKLYAINPKADELYGHECYPSVKDVPEELDLAVIVVPAKYMKPVMNDCAEKGVKSVIIITAGFKEIGEEGANLEKEIMGIAEKAGIRIIGPNCLGIIAPHSNLNASFADGYPEAGDIAFISQSGAFCTAVLDKALPYKLGFSHFVSVGNKADVDENQLIKYWLNDPKVNVISGYLEEIKYGKELLKITREAKNKKPIIVLKPGQSDAAKKAISSHTGSIAGSTQTFKTAVQQSGIIEAESIRDMFNLMMGFSWNKLPKGNKVGLVTNAGGPGIIATDMVVNNGFEMAKFSEELESSLEEKLPSTASCLNPVDVVGDALADRYEIAIRTLIEKDETDIILVLLTPQRITEVENTAKVVINLSKMTDKPIIPVFIGKKYVKPGLDRLFDNKIPAYTEVEDAMTVLKAMHDFYKYSQQTKSNFNDKLLEIAGKGEHTEELNNYESSAENALPDEIVEKLVAEVGLELPKQIITSDVDEAIKFAQDNFPVVVKATNDAIAHKTDFKALYLHIDNEEDLRNAFTELTQTVKENSEVSEPEILIQEEIDYEESIFIGTNRDGDKNVYEEGQPGFGHLIAVGQGGIYTEIYKDFGYVLTPGAKDRIKKAFDSTKVAKIVKGARGKDPLAYDEVLKAIEAIQKLVLLYPRIISLDINPLLVTKDRAIAVDIKIFI